MSRGWTRGRKGRGEGPVPRGRDPTAPQLQAPSKQSYVPLKRVQRALRAKLNARSSITSLPSVYKILLYFTRRDLALLSILKKKSLDLSLPRDISRFFRAFLSLDV